MMVAHLALSLCLAMVRSDGITGPIRVPHACVSALRESVPEGLGGLSDEGFRLVVATMEANRAKPYGSSVALTRKELQKAKALDCDNYAMLVWFLAGRPTGLRMIGFEGGVVGNHAQLYYERDKLLLDPTVGLVARTTLNDLLSGKPVAKSAILYDYGWNNPQLERFGDTVVRALENGLYRPMDLLYFYKSPGTYAADMKAHHGGYSAFRTPGGLKLRARLARRSSR